MLTAHCVFGGFRMAREDWSRTENGHECDYDMTGLDETVYPTQWACECAITEQHGAAA